MLERMNRTTRISVAAGLAILIAVVGFAIWGGSDEPVTSTTLAGDAAAEVSETDSTTTSSSSTTTLAEVPVDEAVWPLTGESSGSTDTTSVPVLIAKIDNTPSSRPQTGLAAADVVFDVLVEGGVSRLLAVYQSQLPVEVGPIRSGREVDSKLIEPFGALFAYSGGQDFVVSRIRSVSTDVGLPRLGDAAYYRSPDRPAPYDVVLRTADVVEVESTGLASGLLFGDLADGAGETATEISVNLSNFNEVDYQYADGSYARSIGGTPHVDEREGQIFTENVVVIFVDVLSTGRQDSSGAAVPDYDVVGSGEAIVFRDGRALEGSWVRSSTGDMFAFVDGQGEPISLAVGRSWIEVVPNGRPATWK